MKKASDYYDPIEEKTAQHKHHIFGGRFKQLSEEFGFYIYLTAKTHEWAQRYMETSGKKFALLLNFKYNKVLLALNTRDIRTLQKQGRLCQEGLKKFEKI